MNVTEFAEQIVFGKTLEDKLLVPGRLSFNKQYAAPNVETLATPGRPSGLQMSTGKGGNIQPPHDNQLENEYSRGQLLHFLANHELLATELMALVLLKFPDAPYAFRQGVLVTLQEEQEHTRMYIRRMKECGVEFGQFPLSGQFWRIIEPMKSPMDFVSQLSLTFEQANLDYSLHFANLFKKIGDLDTSSLLQKIYEDEIGHVQHGLHWFRQWKNPEQSDWEAYQESLEFPMSPNRGRGPKCAFNRDGRIQAGLSEEFIDSIEVFRQSRGRTPEVYWFDPAAEAELDGGLSDREVGMLDGLAKDLELVMVAIAKEDDIVLVRQTPSREMSKHLIDAGFDLPEFIPFTETSKLAGRKLHRFYPWAWTPSNHKIANSLSDVVQRKPIPWRADSENAFRKSFGAQRLANWLTEDPNELFSPAETAGTPVFQISDIESKLAELKQIGYSTSIFKSDLAASGRGQRRFSCDGLDDQDRQWLQFVFSKYESTAQALTTIQATTNHAPSDNQASDSLWPVGIIEPQLDRVIDLSFLWHWPENASTPDFLGWTRPLIAPGRRYAGTRLGNSLQDCDVEIKRFVLEERCLRLQTTIDWLQPKLAAMLGGDEICNSDSNNEERCQDKSHREDRGQQLFHGYFGVDAFVYRSLGGELKIKPMVELNPRMTMGHVALNLQKRIAPGAEAVFRIFTQSEWSEVQSELEDVKLECSRDGHWKSGMIRLSEFGPHSKLVPVVLVGDRSSLDLGDVAF